MTTTMGDYGKLCMGPYSVKMLPDDVGNRKDYFSKHVYKCLVLVFTQISVILINQLKVVGFR